MTRRTALGLAALILTLGAALAPPTVLPVAAQSGSSPRVVDGVVDRGQFLADTVVLCRVGDRATTVADYVRLYFDSYIEDRPASDSLGRVTFLDNIVTKDVLGQIALEINRPFRFEDRVVLREHEQRTLSNALYEVAVLDSINITAADLEREYEYFKWEVRLRHIVFPNRETALRVRNQIQRGAISWNRAYERYSLSKGSPKDKGPDGELGWIVRGGASLQSARTIFSLGAGRMTEPIEERDGWHVYQIAERRPGTPPSLDAMRSFLEAQLRDEQIVLRSRVVRDIVRDEIQMVYDSTNIAWAASQFQPTQSSSMEEGNIPAITLNPHIPHFENADTSRVLARSKDGAFTLGRFFNLYHEIQPLVRPNVSNPESFRDQVDAFAFEPYMARIAKARGLDTLPRVAERLAKKREQLHVEHLYSDSVLSRISIDPQARREYYQANLAGFVTYANVKFASLWASSKAQADSFATLLRNGEKAEDILAVEELLGVKRGSIQTRAENERLEYQKMLFEELRPGQVVVMGPDKEGIYLVLQKLEHIPGHQLSYDEVSGYIDESMQNIQSEKLLQELVDRHKHKFPIMSRPELVMRIKLVDPTL